MLTYGEQPSSVVTLERHYGPRRLRDDDDDDDLSAANKFVVVCEKSETSLEVSLTS